MTLTDNQKNLIKAVAQNDIQSAKKCAIACVAEDTTKKNSFFCNQYRDILQNSTTDMMELPYDLRGFLCVEDVSASFNESRYYLSERESVLYEKIERMKKVSARLMELGLPYLNSTLLYGASGTGKTTFGRYVAFKTGLPFCYLKFSSLIDSYLGSTSRNISKAFNYVLSNPCVFMLDEIDCISIRRNDAGSSNADGEMARITITLMQEFDRIPNNIIVIGATNRIDRIDEALLRRFSVKHKVEELSSGESETLVRKFLSDIPVHFTDHEMKELAGGSCNQAKIINEMMQKIAEKISDEIS